jgi:hypothetical protein
LCETYQTPKIDAALPTAAFVSANVDQSPALGWAEPRRAARAVQPTAPPMTTRR